MMDIYFGDNLQFLEGLAAGAIDLVYLDPPFNTGKAQRRDRTVATQDASAERLGFGGRRYRMERVSSSAFADHFDDYLGFLGPRLEQVYRVLKPQGSLLLHLDYREVHYAKVFLDGLFGRASFMNEIIWAYDYGARTKKRWAPKHDTILWYAKDPNSYTYHYDAIDRIPYLAPKLVGPEKAERGKVPTDVWWHTIVSPTGKEKTGYPTQKPLGILRRLLKVHSSPGDHVLDCFAGSGTTGAAALELGRKVSLVDNNPASLEAMKKRFAGSPFELVHLEGDPQKRM